MAVTRKIWFEIPNSSKTSYIRRSSKMSVKSETWLHQWWSPPFSKIFIGMTLHFGAERRTDSINSGDMILISTNSRDFRISPYSRDF